MVGIILFFNFDLFLKILGGGYVLVLHRRPWLAFYNIYTKYK
jgi:hypothetical protein